MKKPNQMIAIASILVTLGLALWIWKHQPPSQSAANTGAVTIDGVNGPAMIEASAQTIVNEVKKSKVTLVNIWATWCEPCRDEFPVLIEMRRKFQDRGLNVIFVSADFASQKNEAVAFLQQQGVDFTTYIKNEEDSQFITTLYPEWTGAIPATLIFDQNGAILNQWQGAASRDEFEAAIEAALEKTKTSSGKPPFLKMLFPSAWAATPSVLDVVGERELARPDGSKVRIKSLKGKNGTLMIFACNHCPFVKGWADRIGSLGAMAKNQGVGVIVINSNDPAGSPEDAPAKMPEFQAQHHWDFPYLVDETSNIARILNATRTPEVFLFDAKGALAYHGAIDDQAEDAAKVQKPYLKEALEKLKLNQQLAQRETKFIGCSIKFRKAM